MRLVTFGDSYTYGEHLPNPEIQSWPAQLAMLLNCSLVNNAQPGSSNLEILTTILNFPFEENDLVVIGWTYSDRDIIFKEESFFKKLFNKENHTVIDKFRIGAGQKNNKCIDHFYQAHTNFDLSVRSGLYTHHAELFLNSYSINNYHFLSNIINFDLNYVNSVKGVAKKIANFIDPWKIKPVWINKPTNLFEDFVFTFRDFAKDGNHPGILSHKLAADNLYRLIGRP